MVQCLYLHQVLESGFVLAYLELLVREPTMTIWVSFIGRFDFYGLFQSQISYLRVSFCAHLLGAGSLTSDMDPNFADLGQLRLFIGFKYANK